MVIRTNEILTGRIESYDNLQQGINESRARPGAEAAIALSSPPDAKFKPTESYEPKISNAQLGMDIYKTPEELVKNRVFIDKQQQAEAPEKTESLEKNGTPKVSVELQDLTKEQKESLISW